MSSGISLSGPAYIGYGASAPGLGIQAPAVQGGIFESRAPVPTAQVVTLTLGELVSKFGELAFGLGHGSRFTRRSL